MLARGLGARILECTLHKLLKVKYILVRDMRDIDVWIMDDPGLRFVAWIYLPPT